MNKARRETLTKIVGMLETAHAELDGIKSEEEEAFENLSEGLQQADRGQQMENNVSEMDAGLDSLQTALDSLEECIGSLGNVE